MSKLLLQIVPYLICMSTDVEKMVSNSADKQLQEIEKKYPGFIHMKAQTGIRLSYKLQKILQLDKDVVRGFRIREGELPGALNGFLYSILRTKQQRRALVLSILKQFDEQVVSTFCIMTSRWYNFIIMGIVSLFEKDNNSTLLHYNCFVPYSISM